jgi:hypothetical protein
MENIVSMNHHLCSSLTHRKQWAIIAGSQLRIRGKECQDPNDKELYCFGGLRIGGVAMHKFMVALDEKVFLELSRVAKSRNITVQELLRAIVVPEWMRQDNRAGMGLANYRTDDS